MYVLTGALAYFSRLLGVGGLRRGGGGAVHSRFELQSKGRC